MNFKKLFSSLLAGVAGALVPVLAHSIGALPVVGPILSAALPAIFAAAVHYVPALGTKEAVVKSLLQGNEGATVAKVLDKEV